MNHSKKYIAAGVIISNLVMVFVGAFIFPWFWKIQELNQGIALVLMFTIVMVTFCSAIASYFWSFTGIPLKSLRLLAIINHLWILAIFIIHPNIGVGKDNLTDFLLYNFFSKATLVIILFCSLLGNWFGRRVLYE
jgi:hypothetical protein